jgi:hypothetical protein
MIDHQALFFKPGLSGTSINEFINDGASHFWRHSTFNPNRVKKDRTPAMIFGGLAHCLALTPENYETEYAVMPVKGKDDLDTVEQLKAFINAHKAPDQSIPASAKKAQLIETIHLNWPNAVIWQDRLDLFEAQLGKRSPISVDDWSQAKSMQDQLFANRAFRNLVGNGMSETPFCWWPEATEENINNGLMMKCKPDYARNGLVVEYKTTVSAQEKSFSRDMGNMGYHRQLAIQTEAVHRMTNEMPRGQIIIAQDKEYHDDIAIYALDPMHLAIGQREVAAAYEAIKGRLVSGNWKSFSEDIKPIGLPRYYNELTSEIK